MFSTFGEDDLLRIIYTISATIPQAKPVETTTDLRAAYHAFLRSHQPYMPINSSHDPFILDPLVEDELARAYTLKSTLDDLKQARIIGDRYTDADRQERVTFAREAYNHFMSCNPSLALIFDLAIHSIVIRPSRREAGRASHGGSSSAALGTIWLSLADSVTRSDVVEMLLHELTHHLLFLDERAHPHFNYALIAKPENFAYSAILNLSRPLDKVVHSIVVASEILAGRESFLPPSGATTVHPSSRKMREETLRAISSVYDLPNLSELVMPRALDILAVCAEQLSVEAIVS